MDRIPVTRLRWLDDRWFLSGYSATVDSGQVGGKNLWILRLLFGQRHKDGTLGSADQMQKPLKSKQGGSRYHIEETKDTRINVQSGIELPSFLLLIVANSEHPNLNSVLYNVNIRGIKSADTATDIKKAYHKAALRHHPDKAGQLLARSEVGDEGQLWKEISQEVYKDADKLFKMIGEAYAVLSDPAKRSEYDLEEEIRKASKLCNRGGTSRRSSDAYGCGRSSDAYGCGRPFDDYRSTSDRTSNRRNGRDHWKTHGHSYSRW
ncbi:DnaJ like subfamily C member 7 [Glycine soja]|nr:DnaJ like subfamily C member 7 [Glycine soja]